MLNSSTTTDTVIVDAAAKIPPVHPGEILPEDFMKEFGLSQNRVARDPRGPATADQRDRPWKATGPATNWNRSPPTPAHDRTTRATEVATGGSL
jgi:hypothetical protein